MNLGLQGKTAVVTGASKGIGLATARALATEGTRVMAAARTPVPGLAGPGRAVSMVQSDLTTLAGAQTLAARAGDVDILVNNLGGVTGASMRAGGSSPSTTTPGTRRSS
ncbi:MAG TPA: SDR family NAD(P)-dependent oxidoreductase [Streptosporangiaceae bacterium]